MIKIKHSNFINYIYINILFTLIKIFVNNLKYLYKFDIFNKKNTSKNRKFIIIFTKIKNKYTK